MILDYLHSKYHKDIEDGWGAFELENIKKAEKHFRFVLEHEDDPEASVVDIIEAHNGMGAVSRSHKDFFDAWRWYKEAEYLLDEYYKKTGGLPKRLKWNHPHDRPALRTFVGLGHTAYARADKKNARRYYHMILERDIKDELGVHEYMEALEHGKHFSGK